MKKTSYQKRVDERNAARKQADKGAELAREVKHYLLAIARGQDSHAEQVKIGILRRVDELWGICESEKNELTKGGKILVYQLAKTTQKWAVSRQYPFPPSLRVRSVWDALKNATRGGWQRAARQSGKRGKAI